MTEINTKVYKNENQSFFCGALFVKLSLTRYQRMIAAPSMTVKFANLK
jgi:hypothetical protein